jgi:DNA-binding transcriptional regulator YhcF (GntR family)
MDIQIKDTKIAPIYAQVRQQIEAHIRNKQLSAGEALPSPATLAQDLSVDKGEIQRAYYELERSGLVKKITSKDFLGKEKATYKVNSSPARETTEPLNPSVPTIEIENSSFTRSRSSVG